MVLDESALEAMLARGRAAEREHKAADAVRTEQTDEFEVYEREAEPEAPAEAPPVEAPVDGNDEFEVYERPAQAPAPAPTPEPEPEADDFEVFERLAVPEVPPEPTPAPAPVADPAPEPEPTPDPTPAPGAEAERRRPQVWPPIGRTAAPAAHPEPGAAEPEPAPDPEPQAPSEEHAPHLMEGHYEDPTVQPRTHAPTPHAFAQLEVDGSGHRIAIVQALFNQELTDQMVDAAKRRIEATGAEVADVLTVPGVYDLPLPVQTLARKKRIDGIVVIGCVVQGSTKHDELITFSTAKTLQEISLATETPIGLGIIGPGMTWEQAEARVGNGAHAVDAVLALLQH